MIKIVRQIEPDGFPLIYEGIQHEGSSMITYNLYPIFTNEKGVKFIGEKYPLDIKEFAPSTIAKMGIRVIKNENKNKNNESNKKEN